MTYAGDGGEASASLVTAGDVRTLDLRSGTSIRFVARGDGTGGRFGLFRFDMPPRGGGANPHFHRTFSESFYIVDGAVDLHDGRAWIRRAAGDFLYVPEGGIHGFRNESDAPASLLILFAPGAPRERYFEELADIARAGQQLSVAEWTELYARARPGHDLAAPTAAADRRARTRPRASPCSVRPSQQPQHWHGAWRAGFVRPSSSAAGTDLARARTPSRLPLEHVHR